MIRPEQLMVRRALIGGSVALVPAAGIGLLAGTGGAVSAVLGVVIVVANFAAHGLSLAWAAGNSIIAIHAVALAGFVLRMGAIVGAMFALSHTSFFSPLAFGVAIVASTLALLASEARLYLAQQGSGLEIPPDPIAMQRHQLIREEATR